MDQPRAAKDLSEYQDVFGHMITVQLYTPICHCFPVQNASSWPKIIDALSKGLERLSASFPWLAGQAIHELAEGRSGVAKIVPLGKTCPLTVKDLTNDPAVPSMDALRKANFPFSMLDGEILTPLIGPPISREGDPAPIFFVQANFINGGLLLVCAGEHGAMDGQGLGQVIRLFSKACRSEPFTDDELLQGNRARGNLIPLFDPTTYKPGPELDYLIVKPSATPPPALSNSPPNCSWGYFHFPSSSLSKLKSIASSLRSAIETESAAYITTNDAVSAFVWQSTSRVRSSRVPPQTTSTFARAVDVRSSLSIPPTYLGNMSNHTYNTLPLSSVLSASLSSLASTLRLALKPSYLSLGIRSLATKISFNSDKSIITYGANMDFSRDIFFSSWARLPCYSLDFNLGLGFPESVRRPRFGAVEGLIYLMPMDRSGGVDAAICVSDDDMKGLRDDREFGEYAQWIG